MKEAIAFIFQEMKEANTIITYLNLIFNIIIMIYLLFRKKGQ